MSTDRDSRNLAMQMDPEHKLPNLRDITNNNSRDYGIAIPTFNSPGEDFNLGEYLNSYQGWCKIRRAIYLGERCPVLAAQSYHIALTELKANTADTATYQEIYKRLSDLDQTLPPMDTNWINETNLSNSEEFEELNRKIKEAKSNNLKSDGLDAQIGIARLTAATGKTDEAIRAWQNTREFASTLDHQTTVTIESAKLFQAAGKWMQMASYLQRAMTNLSKSSKATTDDVMAMTIQADFGEGRWAAVVGGLGTLKYDDIMKSDAIKIGALTAKDIAVYITLAGLATLPRDELKQKVIDNEEVGKFLVYAPECFRILQSHNRSNYGESLGELQKLYAVALFDPAISLQVNKIKNQILEGTIVLYIQPFVSASLETMAQALQIGSVNNLKKMLIKLIEKETISYRIDAVSGYLMKHTVSHRDQALESMEDIYESFNKQSSLLLARIQYLEEEVAVTTKESKRERKRERRELVIG